MNTHELQSNCYKSYFTQRGFTLIELMIVVAIVGILAAVAIPIYQDYIAKSQASEATQLLSGLRTPIAETYTREGFCPDFSSFSQKEARLSGKYVDAIVSDTALCNYSARFKASGISAKLVGRSINMVFNTQTHNFRWTCPSVPDNLKPVPC